VIELVRALGAFADPPSDVHARLAALLELGPAPDPTEHADLFLFQLPPFASIYLGPEGKLGGEARDRVAGFWRAVGQSPPPEPDHLGALLGLYAALREAESAESDPAQRALLGEGATALLGEHLMPWVGPYLARVGELAAPFYQRWAGMLLSTLEHEGRQSRLRGRLPLHLREAPPLPDPRVDGGGSFLDGLLTPVSSGLFLTRADLARGAAQARVGVRAGERRYALEAMLSQDATPVLAWLQSEGRTWAARHLELASVVGEGIASFWSERARTMANMVGELVEVAGEPTPCPS
jgi:hypothetical protein